MAKKSEVDDYNLAEECRKCKLAKINGGKCPGRTMRANPCLVFKEK